MYFKTHQLEKGEQLLLEALESYGPDRGMYMTLGTLYSGLYDYNNSKRFYLKAIEDALETDDPYFASVAYYNLSLLEHSFYHFNSALRYTEESIRSSDRAPEGTSSAMKTREPKRSRSALSGIARIVRVWDVSMLAVRAQRTAAPSAAASPIVAP